MSSSKRLHLHLRLRESRHALRPLALALAAAFAWSAHAQPVDSPTVATLAPITVTGDSLDAYTAETTSIGSKLPATLKSTPQSISVMTRQRIEEQNLTSLDEVMAQTPGVTVDLSGTAIIPAYYSRGFAVESFQYDGVPIQTGGASWSQPDMVMFERVEVLRGAAGLFNGAGQPGGVINLVRKRPGREREFSGLLGLGSWNNRRLELDYSTPFNQSGSVRGRVAAAYDDRESHIDYVQGKRRSAYGIIEADLMPRTTLSFGAGYQKRNWTPPFGGLPRYADGSDLNLSRSTFLSTPWTYWNFETKQVFAELSHALDDDWQIKFSAVHDHETSDLKYGYTRGAVDPRTLRGPMLAGGANAYENTQLGLDAYLTGAFRAFGRRHELVVGANWYDRDAESWNGSLPGFGGTPVDVFDPDPAGTAEPGDPVWGGKSLSNTRQHGIYGALRMRLADPLTVLAGGRVSWWETKTRNLLTGAQTAAYDESGQFTPYLGVIYDLDPTWALYASYTDIFRVQSNYLDTDGNGLPPVRGANVEVGIKGAFRDGRVNTSFALFRINETDRAVQVTDTVVSGCCYATNGEVRSQGVEAEITGEVLPGWQLGAGYTFNLSKYLTDPVNSGQPFRTSSPKHLLRLWTSYQLPGELNAWTVGGGVNVQSGIYTEGGRPTARVSQAGYAVANLRVGYRIDRHWSAAVNVNNLFDRGYYSRLGSPGFGPATMGNVYGEPRNVMLTLRARY